MRANRKFEAAIPNQEDARIKKLQRELHGTKLQEAIDYKPEGDIELGKIWKAFDDNAARGWLRHDFPRVGGRIHARRFSMPLVQAMNHAEAAAVAAVRVQDIIELQQKFVAQGLGVDFKIAHQIHDEFVVDMPKVEELRAAKIIQDKAEKAIVVKEPPKYNALAWFNDDLAIYYNDGAIGSGHSRRAYDCDYKKDGKEFIIKEAKSKGGRLSNMMEYAIYHAAINNKVRWRHLLPEFAAISECGYFVLVEKCLPSLTREPYNRVQGEFTSRWRNDQQKMRRIFKQDMHESNWGYTKADDRPVVLDMAVDDTAFYGLAMKAQAEPQHINKVLRRNGYTDERIDSVYRRAA